MNREEAKRAAVEILRLIERRPPTDASPEERKLYEHERQVAVRDLARLSERYGTSILPEKK